MSDYQSAGVVVGHNLYTLRAVIEDMRRGFDDKHERRFLSAEKEVLAQAIDVLVEMLDAIEAADTSQVERRPFV
jgi:hypothetical protein